MLTIMNTKAVALSWLIRWLGNLAGWEGLTGPVLTVPQLETLAYPGI